MSENRLPITSISKYGAFLGGYIFKVFVLFYLFVCLSVCLSDSNSKMLQNIYMY